MIKTRPAVLSLFLAVLIFVCALPSGGQVTTGTPPFGSFGGGPDIVNLGNLNAHINVPVFNKAGRGLSFNYNLTYDSSVWYPVTSGGTTTWQPVADWGWSAQTQPTTGYITYAGINEGRCTDRGASF